MDGRSARARMPRPPSEAPQPRPTSCASTERSHGCNNCEVNTMRRAVVQRYMGLFMCRYLCIWYRLNRDQGRNAWMRLTKHLVAPESAVTLYAHSTRSSLQEVCRQSYCWGA